MGLIAKASMTGLRGHVARRNGPGEGERGREGVREREREGGREREGERVREGEQVRG